MGNLSVGPYKVYHTKKSQNRNGKKSSPKLQLWSEIRTATVGGGESGGAEISVLVGCRAEGPLYRPRADEKIARGQDSKMFTHSFRYANRGRGSRRQRKKGDQKKKDSEKKMICFVLVCERRGHRRKEKTYQNNKIDPTTQKTSKKPESCGGKGEGLGERKIDPGKKKHIVVGNKRKTGRVTTTEWLRVKLGTLAG